MPATTSSHGFVNNKLQAIPGVVSTETLISLEQSIKREIPVLLDED